MQARLNIYRATPRSRRVIEGLIGRMKVSLTACAKSLRDPADSYLHVGSGQLPIRVDEEELKTILRREKDLTTAWKKVKIETGYIDFNRISDTPVIPGASVKGNVRSRIELSFRTLENKVRSCFIRAHGMGSRSSRHYKVWGDVIFELRRPCDYNRFGTVCIVCNIFGTAGLIGLVDFNDFYGSDVRLKLLTVSSGEEEVQVMAAPPGSRFTGEIYFRNLRPVDLGMLLMGMRIYDRRRGKPVLFGRFKYTGIIDGYSIGKATYTLESLELSEFSQPFRDVQPGSVVVGDDLDPVVKELAAEFNKRFGREFKQVNEVGGILNI